jgi:hypothetical protein
MPELKCPHKECNNNDNGICPILDITKKIPKNILSCSYSHKRKTKKEWK